jgi:hypothetical protein
LGGRHLDPDSRTIASWDRSAQPASCAITTQPDRRGRQNLPSRPGPQHMGSCLFQRRSHRLPAALRSMRQLVWLILGGRASWERQVRIAEFPLPLRHAAL